jgi:hypothetical protein
MPYIDNEDKEKYDANKLEHCGILNYAVNQLINDYIEQNGKCYQTFNDITGALENAKLEIYRRMVGPYEDEKIDQNGDVPPYTNYDKFASKKY